MAVNVYCTRHLNRMVEDLPTVYRGNLEEVTRSRVRGWATLGANGTPVNVCINGNLAVTINPVVLRPDVAKVHSCSPLCGFSIDLPQHTQLGSCLRHLEPGDIVSVHYPNSQHLPGSPWPAFCKAKFNFGDFGLQPITDDWGFSRGQPVDRYYVEAFLGRHAYDIRGKVLEVGDNGYTSRYGGARVVKSDVLDLAKYNETVTYVADLTDAPNVPTNTFDCVILTQVLELIQDVSKAIQTVCRVLKPGGVALITVPGISQISSLPQEAATWSWSFYPQTLRRLLTTVDFDSRKLLVDGHGNLKTAVSFLAGLAQDDLEPEDFEMHDFRYPLIVTARAVRNVHEAESLE